jgi:hypothetical protein
LNWQTQQPAHPRPFIGHVLTWLTAAGGGTMPTMLAPSTGWDWVTALRSIFAGFGIFFLGSLSDVWLQQHASNLSIAMMDDALVGVGAGLLVFLYERRQRHNLIRKLEVIRMMNHHVRNSLQVISLASSAHLEKHANKVQDAVERIEWALREVLPGQREDINDLLFHSQSDETAHKSTMAGSKGACHTPQ